MKAIRIHQFGGPEVLKYEDAPDPKPGADQVLVRIRAAGVNPVDTYVRAGTYASKPPLPYIAGTEFAGEIVEGPRKGERVFALSNASGRNTGAYAELAVVKSNEAYPLPDQLSFAQGAAVPVAFGTAYRALADRANVKPGEIVLIHGATGGVGTAAVQIASLLGCVVIGTGSSEKGRSVVKDLGAAHVFNHKDANYLDQIKQSTGGRGIDVVIEFLANVNLDNDLDLLAAGGRVVVIGSRGRIEIDPRRTMGKESAILGTTLWGGGEIGLHRAFSFVAAALAKKALTPIIGQEFPLADAAEAHEFVMKDGNFGKVVLTC